MQQFQSVNLLQHFVERIWGFWSYKHLGINIAMPFILNVIRHALSNNYYCRSVF
jgi:hypothetical protein